jgi:hypothetical protein
MPFVSFRKEAEEVGEAAMDTVLPFDQKYIFEESMRYIQAQLNISNVDFIKLDESDVPDRVQENFEHVKPQLWLDSELTKR